MGAPTLTHAAALWTRCAAKAEQVSATVLHASGEDAAIALLREATPTFSCTRSVADRFPHLADAGTRLQTAADVQRNRAELFRTAPAKDVVSVGRVAVAETGSVIFDEPPIDRGACLLAERLWLLVSETDIVDGLDRAMQRMCELVEAGSHHPLLMTGPSRTADIERTLTVGVHGPRALVIVVVAAA